ncbi:MAG: T9SS type A sorting domain-containing protein [Flavobacteriales bacterium]|nr:T9SS type A sorting domain-containing protein [Flavobacteriales bacterium]
MRAWALAALGSAALGSANAQAILLEEHFTGGASTTGFTIVPGPNTVCNWLYAPDGVTAGTFNMDFGGAPPSGAGFDGDFVYIDSDVCGGSGITVNSFLVSPSFDASSASTLVLTFSHQYHHLNSSFGKVEVYNGSEWTEVANYTTNTGWENPATTAMLDITAAAGGSTAAQLRFQFSSAWDWWWALDNIIVADVPCAAPEGLAVANVTTTGAVVDFTPNGSASYEWVVTNGQFPGTGGDIVTGFAPGGVAAGLTPNTPYTVFVRAMCNSGGESLWSGGVSFATLAVPPANDDCSGAIALTVNPDYNCAATTPGTVVGATPSNVTSTCGGTANDDVWFSFTATGTMHTIALDYLSGSTGDLYHALWRGTCNGLELVPNSCSDPELSSQTGLSPGTIYYLQVYTWTNTPGQTSSFSVCIGTPPPPPANDDCSGAIALTVNPDYNCGVTTPGTIVGATASGVTSTCFGTADDDVWFSFVATGTAHNIVLGDLTGSTTDLYHALWRGTCNGLELVPGSCSDPETSFQSGLSSGTTYYVQVYTWTNTPGQTSSFSVCIGTPPPPPANDECSGAIALTVNPDYNCGVTTPGTIVGATASGVTSTCFGTADDDVWFSFSATETTHNIFLSNITGSTTDLYHALWRGTCDGLELVPGSCSDPELSLQTGLSPGTTYYLQVYSWTSTAGQTSSFSVCIGTPPPPPANDECSGAIALTVNPNYDCGATTPGTIAGATASNVTTTCFGTADDDVWFSFTATAATHRIVLGDITGSTTDLYHALWRGTCDGLELVPGSCSDPETSDPTGLQSGTTYYLQVYSWTDTGGQTSSFSVCIGSAPTIGIAESAMAAEMRVYPNPAQDLIIFEVNNANVQRVRMIDAAGRHVLDAPFARVVGVSSLDAGAYTALLFDRNGVVVGRSRFVKD